MSDDLLSEESQRGLARAAAGHAEAVAATELGLPVRAELLRQQVAWTQFRCQVDHHLRLLQEVTRIAVVFDDTTPPRLLGWQIEKRMDSSREARLGADELMARARALPEIGDSLPLMHQGRLAIDAERACVALRFGSADPASQIDVWVNHSTGEVIGLRPVQTGVPTALDLSGLADPQDPLRPAPADAALGAMQDAALKVALETGRELAWSVIERTLSPQVDAPTLAQARAIFQFTPEQGAIDDAGRWTLRYRLWRQYSSADVGIDARSGEIVSWFIEAHQADAPRRRISAEQALRLAQPHLLATQGVSGPSVSFGTVGDDQKASVHWWHHEDGFNIEGDHSTVMVNADAGTVFAIARKWRPVAAALLAPPLIDAGQALSVAEQAHGSGAPGRLLGRSIIELGGSLEAPVAVVDVPVWRVGFRELGGLGFTEVAVDCRSAEIVRVTGW